MTSSSSEGNARRWFVTGASSGIGRAIIERALADGDAVIASVRKPQALDDLQSLFPRTLEVEPLDVRDREATSATVKRVLRRGPVDIVVNNAGYGAVGAAEELTNGHVDDQLQTLLHGPIAITRAFLPALRKQGGGRIVQISSVAGQTVVRGASVYHAAKWGLEGFTESVAREVAGFGIRFTLIEPGAIRTGFARALQFASPLTAYQTGPVAEFRRYAGGGNEVYTGDPAKVASIIVDVTKMTEPPLRLALGCDAYTAIESTLQERVRELAHYRELSCSVAHAD
jgi:NAD(P)-dependent dehydrogenase (short-subunit alcohol dehydrogenase family)